MLSLMTLEQTKVALAAAWILVIGTVGVVAGATSSGARLLLAAFALVLPLGILLFWHAPSQSLSETIQRARR